MKLQTFSDIVTAIREAIGVQAADTNAINKIKRLVNIYYLEEVVPFKNWWWLTRTTQIVHKTFFGSGLTAAVTNGSTTVTMSVAPSAGLGSFAGYRFSVSSESAVYFVDTHTAGSATLTLTIAYQEDDNTEIGFQVWRDRFDLPENAKETIQIYHAERTRPLDAVGMQRFRELEAADPKVEGVPQYYSATDFVAAADPESEDARYRQGRVYPAITDHPIMLNVDYVQDDIPDLVDDADEPLMPIGDRVVLYHGAGAEAWAILSRNEDMADRWRLKANAKLARMAAEREDGMDTPKIKPRHEYVNAIRRSGLKSWRRRIWRWM